MISPAILAALLATGLLGPDTAPASPPPSETAPVRAPEAARGLEVAGGPDTTPLFLARAGAIVVVAVGTETRVVAVPETGIGRVVLLEGGRVLVTYATDFDLDGDVDQGDLQIFLLFYGLRVGNDELRGNSDRYDIDRSGRVDAADWTILRGEHGSAPVSVPSGARVAEEVPLAVPRGTPSP